MKVWMLRKYNLIFLVLLLIMSACHRDDLEYFNEVVTLPSAKIYVEVDGSVSGYVYDEEGKPVANARVQMYSASAMTNELGLFFFRNAKMDQQGTYIRVVKEGYLTGSDYLFPKQLSVNYSYIRLIKNKLDKSFESAIGGTVALEGGGHIVFPPNAIRKSTGEDYDGTVQITARYIDPASSFLRDEMPGGLMGIDFKGSRVILGTAGMFAVEMQSPKGERLNLRENHKASFSLPVGSASMPPTIATWSFDEYLGMWKEEGTAILEDDKYIGEVSHFSFWNCDAPFEIIEVCGKVTDQHGNGVSSAKIKVEAITGGVTLGVQYGYTQQDGSFCGKMPKNAELKITVSAFGCDNNAVTVAVGPFANDAVLNDIVINLPSEIIEGSVECNGSTLSHAILILRQGDKVVAKDIQGGSFQINLYDYFCDDQNIEVSAYDLTTSKSSPVWIFDSNAGPYTLNVCSPGCDLQADFISICNPVTIQVSGGSGNYHYLWNTGETTPSINISSQNAQLYSVTVTDAGNPGCSQVFTRNIPGLIDASIVQNGCKLPFSLFVSGKNYDQILWSTGETSQFIEVNPNTITTYSVTVTNNEGCSSVSTIVVDPANAVYVSVAAVSCNKERFTLDGYFNDGYLYGSINQYTKYLAGPQDLIDLNVLETGYSVSGYINGNNCESGFEVQLPYYDGLKITNYTSGEVINGNIIQYTTNGNCYNCTTGTVSIYSENDLATDLVQQNAAGLPPGVYYVVVTDATTGCFVAHKKVKIL